MGKGGENGGTTGTGEKSDVEGGREKGRATGFYLGRGEEASARNEWWTIGCRQ